MTTEFLDLEILIILNLSGWKAMPHFLSHAASLSKFSWSTMQSCWFLIHLYRIQSSAKSHILDWPQSSKWLINIRNSRGPKTVPCGIGLMMVKLLEAAPLTNTCC